MHEKILPGSEENDLYSGQYLTIKTDGAELQARADFSNLRQCPGEESYILELEPGSANGSMVGWLSTGQEVRSGVVNGTVLKSLSVLDKLAIRYCPAVSGGEWGWAVSLEGDYPSQRLVFREAIVIVGSPTTLDKDGEVLLEDGELNPDFFVGPADR